MSRFRRPAPRIRRVRRGVYELRLPEKERDVLRSLCGELRSLLGSQDPSTVRLFPPGYGEDRAASQAYAEMVHDDLMSAHLGAIEIVEGTLDATRLDDDQMAAWLAALNQVRLVLGSRLEVTEDLYERGVAADDPRTPQLAVYEYLGWLQQQVVEALAGDLDPAGTEGP